jgi:hypothetical protein
MYKCNLQLLVYWMRCCDTEIDLFVLSNIKEKSSTYVHVSFYSTLDISVNTSLEEFCLVVAKTCCPMPKIVLHSCRCENFRSSNISLVFLLSLVK